MSVLSYTALDSAGFALIDGSLSWKMVFTVLQDMHEADFLFGSGVHSLVRAASVICRFGACRESMDLDIQYTVYDFALKWLMCM